jgi:8-oxo-dGTP pyrophosphatase MutT (NUDIX family)
MTADEWLERTRQALADYIPRRLDTSSATPAAILLLVYDREGEAHVLFTERTHQVEHHKGQISFPGGACDDGDDCLETTALRETSEEIGVRPEDVEIVGQLDEMLTISNFRVTPYVGILTTNSEYPFVINEHEVAQVVQVPLPHLLDERNMELEVRQHKGKQVLVPAYTFEGHRIWGATARMLRQFLELLT